MRSTCLPATGRHNLPLADFECLLVLVLPQLPGSLLSFLPAALNMGATLQTAIDAEDDSPEGDEAKASMQAGGSLAAMNPAADAAYVTPLIEIRGFSFKWLKPAAADPDTPAPPVNLKPTDSIMAGVNRQPTMRRFVDTHRASMMSRRMDSLKVPAGTSPLGTPRVSGAGPFTQLTSAGSVKDVENPSSAHTEAETEAIRARARMRRLGSLSSTASGDFRQRPGQSGDVQVRKIGAYWAAFHLVSCN